MNEFRIEIPREKETKLRREFHFLKECLRQHKINYVLFGNRHIKKLMVYTKYNLKTCEEQLRRHLRIHRPDAWFDSNYNYLPIMHPNLINAGYLVCINV